MSRSLAVIILAAGLGKRTNVDAPKVLLPLCGSTLLGTVLATVRGLQPDRTVLVLHHGKEQVENSLSDHTGLEFVDQGAPRGTGHAAQAGMEVLEGFDGDVLVLYGDVPLITADTLNDLRSGRGDGVMSFLTAFASPPEGMGRVLRGGEGQVLGVREQRDCSAVELEIEEFNAGLYCFDAKRLPEALAALRADNAQNELYLTDTVGWFIERGEGVHAVAADSLEEVTGVNSLAELSEVRQLLQERILVEHLQNGVLIEDPATTYIDQDVTIGRNTRILPCTVIGTGVTIGSDCEVGPFSHLRVGTFVDDTAEVGNFVECKKTFVGKGSKAKHLTYLGDTTIGEGANIGAGTITANYDGTNKHPTMVGDGAFIGSGTVLVAPCNVGKQSMTGAGAVVTKNTSIADGDVVVGVPAKSLSARTSQQPAVGGES